jgi:hypothetical protein
MGTTEFRILPLFFGPSRALTDYVPKLVRRLAADLPGLQVAVAPPVIDDATDDRVARLLAERVRSTAGRLRTRRPAVVLVDHGSPVAAVAAVRDRVARQLAVHLGGDASAVVAASMERRPEDDYAFNEPLLERALLEPPCGNGAGDVIVALLFFSPGRHAGPGGDIERICRRGEEAAPGMRVHLAPVIGTHPLLVDILAERFERISPGKPAPD